MKFLRSTFLFAGALFAAASLFSRPAAANPHTLSAGKLRFEKNLGQTDKRVRYVARGRGMTVYMTDRAAIFALSAPRVPKASGKNGTVPVTLHWRAATGSAAFEPKARQSGVTRYYRGNDPRNWLENVPTFDRVLQRNLYPGIDVVYYGDAQGAEGRMEYDFVVKPGADPRLIAFDVSGGGAPHLTRSGDLVVDAAGEPFTMKRPSAYQPTRTGKRAVSSRFVLSESAGQPVVRLALANYDHHLPLIVDPAVVYSTYLGGSDWESDPILNVDAAGNATICGSTVSLDLPVHNAVQSSYRGNYDACIMKLDPNGGLIYATYLGGSNTDGIGHALVDSQGGIVAAGVTQSTDFPISNAFQPTYGPLQSGGLTVYDHFVTRLDATGALVYSTYCGGSTSSGESPFIALDGSDNVALTFQTNIAGFPMVNAAQPTPGGSDDAIVAKLDTAGNLIYSTYWGGSAIENPRGICVDSAGNAIVAGGTGSSDFPLHNAVRTTGGVFVAKFSPSGANLWSTRWGGTVSDIVNQVASDGAGGAVLCGTTTSPDFPTTSAAQSTLAGGKDLFVMRVTSGGGTGYATYLGGALDENPAQIATSSDGGTVVVGSTYSHNYPVLHAVQATNPSADSAGFVSRLSPTGALVYSSYVAGATYGTLSGVTIDASGNAYLAGYVSGAGPTYLNPVQYVGGRGGILTVLDPTGTLLFCSPVFTNGTGYGYANAVALDALGRVYVAGSTFDVDMPAGNAVQPDGPYYSSDFYLAKLDLGAPGILLSTVGNDHLAGYAATGYVTLSPAPAGGAVVSLTSSDPVVTVPATVTIPAGANSASFPIASTDVTSTHAALLTAAYNGLSWTTRFRVQPVLLHYFKNLYYPGYGGFTTTFRLRMEALHDTTVSFTSTDGAVHPPASIVYPAGTASMDIPVSTDFTYQQRTAVVSAYAGDRVLRDTVTVLPDKISDFRVPSPIIGGRSALGTVVVTKVPNGGYPVTLTSSNPDVLSVPSSVTVTDQTTNTANFTVTTYPVTVKTLVTISVTGGANSFNPVVSVEPLCPVRVDLDASTTIAGNSTTGTVFLNAKTDGAFTVQLSSDNPAVSLPASVDVPAGADHASFTVSTNGVPDDTVVTITASGSGYSATNKETVIPLRIKNFGVSAGDVPGGTSLTANVYFNGPVPAGGATLSFSSDQPGAATMPATVSVNAGQTAVLGIPVTTYPIAADVGATLTAALPYSSKTALLEVRAAALHLIGVNPSTVVGGQGSIGNVILTGVAPAGGFVVSLSSSSAAASLPASMTVPAGSQSATFAITTSAVTADASATITATHGAQTTSTALNINSPVIAGLKLAPAPTVGGNTVVGTVLLSGIAPAGGALVTLASNSTKAQVPANVSVPAGAQQASFNISTSLVAANVTAKLTATYKKTPSVASLLITPALKGLTIAPTSVVGGLTATGTISLNGPVTGGITVNLSTTNPAASVPATVTIPDGATTGKFTITTSAVSSNTAGTVSASVSGVTKSATLTVKPPALSALAFSPTAINSGQQATCTVTLTGPAPSAFVVNLTSSNPSLLPSPASVTFAAGSKTATFTSTAGSTASAAVVTVTGKDPAGVTKSKPITIKP